MNDLSVTVLADASDATATPWAEWERDGYLHVFQTRAFALAWYRLAAPVQGYDVRLAVVAHRGKPCMLFPLAVRRRFGMRVAEFCGGLLCDYEAPVLAPDCPDISGQTMQRLWKSIIRACGAQVGHLRQVPHQIPGPCGMPPRANPLALLALTPAGSSSAALSEGQDGDAYILGHVRKGILQDSRRQRKRLAALGEVAWRVAADAEDAGRLTLAMVAQKRRRYAETGVFDIFSQSGTADFYVDLARRLHADTAVPRAHVSVLEVAGAPVAVHWGLRFRGVFSYLMPSYEGGDWQRYSCGRLHLEELLRQTLGPDCPVFDFTVGAEGYKGDWCNSESPIGMACTPVSCAGRLYAAMLSVKRALAGGRQ